MKPNAWPEENHARNLHGKLIEVFRDDASGTIVAIDGAGVHWKCTVTCDARLCLIHCFDVKGPEYLSSFDHQKEVMAMGRTSSMADTIAAAKDWIEGQEVSQLQNRFEFVDKQKRFLNFIAAQAIKVCPELLDVTHELRHQIPDHYELWFRSQDRSCRASFWGKNVTPDAVFHWDECRIFSVQTGDFAQLALLLKRWLCDHVLPSALKKEFPSIELGKVARYYEEGRGIEGEFIESWDNIEKFYEEMNFPPAEAIRTLISSLRQRGYDRTLRAGQSLYTLILSRSRRHGLKEGQPEIAFRFCERGMNVCANNFKEAMVTVPDVALTDSVEVLLKQLELLPID